MTITAEDVRAVALAIATTNGNNDPEGFAEKVVSAFDREQTAAPAFPDASITQPTQQ